MASKNTKNINIEISIDTWKRIKIVSIDTDSTIQEVVCRVLEKHFHRKVKQDEIEGT